PLEQILFCIHFILLVFLFVLTCFADQRPSRQKSSNLFRMATIGSLKEDLRNGISLSFLSSTLLIKNNLVQQSSFCQISSGKESSHKECPDQRVSFLSRRTYWWFH